MEAPDEIQAELLDETGTIRTDVACRRCGYNLRGLDHTSRCPECGTAIGLSCYGDLLRFADPNWVETLARGARFILWGILCAILAGILSVVLAAVMGPHPSIYIVSLAGSLVGLYGAWLITEPDPSGIGEDKSVTDRKIVRFALLVGLLAQVFYFIGESVSLPPGLWLLLAGATVLVGLIGIIGEFAKLTYFRKLALRIPDQALAKRANSLRWIMAISLGIIIIAGSGLALFAKMGTGGTGMATGTGMGSIGIPTSVPATGPTTFSAPFTTTRGGGSIAGMAVFGCIIGVASLVYFIVAILILILVYRLGKAFRAQAQMARISWWPAGESDENARYC